MDKNKVYIVGAGPGDPELLTVKANNLIKSADYVLYDELFGSDILALLPPNAEKVYAGKRHKDEQDQTERQERINMLMLEAYNEGKKVVRLKTGDPLIFGRGIEEIRFLAHHSVPYELIPGITAGIAGANAFSVPLTERRKNTALLICTGHTLEHGSLHFEDIAVFIKKGNPVVVYMGYKKLGEIIKVLEENGVSKETGICIMSQVSHKGEAILEGTLKNIEGKIEANPLPLPTVIIIGQYAESV